MKARQIIAEEIKKQNFSNKSLGNLIGASESTISRYLNNTRETPLEVCVKIFRTLKPELELPAMRVEMRNYTKPERIRSSMEFASTNREMEILEELIEKGENHTNEHLQEFAKVYKLVLRMQRNEIKPMELYDVVRHEKGNFPETVVLLRLIELYSLFNAGEYRFLKASMGNIEQSILALEDEYLRESYLARLDEILASIALRQNDLKTAKKHARRTIESKIGLNFSSVALYTFGATYMLSDMDKSINYFKKSQKIFKKLGKKNMVHLMEYNIQFVKVLWDKNDIDFYIDPALKAYAMIKNGQEEGLEMLNSIDSKEGNSPLRDYMKGDIESLYSALKVFNKQGDMFNAHMVKIKLLALGQPSYILDALC